MNHFADTLFASIRRLRAPICVGLDPRYEQLPDSVRGTGNASMSNQAEAYEQFSRGVIDVVAPLVPAVKVQAAFYEELGPDGMRAMSGAINYAREKGLLVIVDGKRNDIGSTALAYARAYLGRGESAWGADAITVSPYLGDDSLSPFVETARERNAGLFVLVKTSNPGGRMIQDLTVETSSTPGSPQRLYQLVGRHVEQLAAQTAAECGYGAVGAVVGATYPEQLTELRAAMPHTWLLVPGFGSQGGTASDVARGFDAQGLGAIVNNSRGIIFAHERAEYRDRFGPGRWQEAVEQATRTMIDELRSAVAGL